MHIGYGNTKHEYRLDGKILAETKIERDLGILVDNELNFSKHIRSIVAKANRIIELIKISFESIEETKDVKMFSNLYSTLIRPHLEYCVQAWSPHLKKDIEILENVQRRATKLVRQYSHLEYEERLEKLELTKLEDRRTRGDMILTYRLLNGHEGVEYQRFFTLLDTPYNLRRHSKTIERTTMNLDIRKSFYSRRIIEKWNSLSEEEVSASCTSAFKRIYDYKEANGR